MPSLNAELSLPRTQTAIIAQGPGKLAIQHDVAVPTLAPDMAIGLFTLVASSPIPTMLDYSPAQGAIHGYDFAGTIVALGKDAPAHLSVGDRVAGMVFGGNSNVKTIGGFSQYVGAMADLLLRLPEDMSFEEGASLGTGVATATLSLFDRLRVPATLDDLRRGEPKQGEFVLVAGGSTASGTRAIQLLKNAGLRPIASCSPSNFALVERFGAEKVFDYHSPTCAQEIREYTRNELEYALDCVSQADTTKLCFESIGRAGGRYVSLEPFRDTVAQTRALTIEPSWVMVLSIFGIKVGLEGEYGREATPEDRRFGAQAFAAVQSLLDGGKIQAHPIKVMPGGWEGVMKGVDIIRSQSLSGQKMVYSVV
ncbi:putative secondary metabolism biosynthetic enzyme [Podospora bellae-mahoneyi]|uniref:Secondary metabolism biosynthetic enzyme n=1 Tax=Podospora bellae-mahoneyi TaxID=2093777 RepID=A0ABR0FGM2_9PEZI|nr:putative secondary metabolism biosynthetic enzyme [Podospora bellae-mahoneyi]